MTNGDLLAGQDAIRAMMNSAGCSHSLDNAQCRALAFVVIEAADKYRAGIRLPPPPPDPNNDVLAVMPVPYSYFHNWEDPRD